MLIYARNVLANVFLRIRSGLAHCWPGSNVWSPDNRVKRRRSWAAHTAEDEQQLKHLLEWTGAKTPPSRGGEFRAESVGDLWSRWLSLMWITREQPLVGSHCCWMTKLSFVTTAETQVSQQELPQDCYPPRRARTIKSMTTTVPTNRANKDKRSSFALRFQHRYQCGLLCAAIKTKFSANELTIPNIPQQSRGKQNRTAGHACLHSSHADFIWDSAVWCSSHSGRRLIEHWLRMMIFVEWTPVLNSGRTIMQNNLIAIFFSQYCDCDLMCDY